jgi:hypothetical protein
MVRDVERIRTLSRSFSARCRMPLENHWFILSIYHSPTGGGVVEYVLRLFSYFHGGYIQVGQSFEQHIYMYILRPGYIFDDFH